LPNAQKCGKIKGIFMKKTNAEVCPKYKSSSINKISKIESGDAIIRSIGSQEYPKFTNVFYQCECNKCGELFGYWPTKKLGEKFE